MFFFAGYRQSVGNSSNYVDLKMAYIWEKMGDLDGISILKHSCILHAVRLILNKKRAKNPELSRCKVD